KALDRPHSFRDDLLTAVKTPRQRSLGTIARSALVRLNRTCLPECILLAGHGACREGRMTGCALVDGQAGGVLLLAGVVPEAWPRRVPLVGQRPDRVRTGTVGIGRHGPTVARHVIRPRRRG